MPLHSIKSYRIKLAEIEAAHLNIKYIYDFTFISYVSLNKQSVIQINYIVLLQSSCCCFYDNIQQLVCISKIIYILYTCIILT